MDKLCYFDEEKFNQFFKTPPVAPLRPSCVPLLLFLDTAFHTNSQEPLLLLHRKKNIDTVKEPALMGTVCPQLTILFSVAIFSFFALHFVSAKANPMLTATPNPKIRTKKIKLLTVTPNKKIPCLMILLPLSFISLF